jgi:hypothetical protein
MGSFRLHHQDLRDMLNTPEKRTAFMRSWMECEQDTQYLIDVKDFGYDNRQHCEEELLKYDKEVCFYFFPHLKGQDDEDQQAGISTGYSVTIGGGSYAG